MLSSFVTDPVLADLLNEQDRQRLVFPIQSVQCCCVTVIPQCGPGGVKLGSGGEGSMRSLLDHPFLRGREVSSAQQV